MSRTVPIYRPDGVKYLNSDYMTSATRRNGLLYINGDFDFKNPDYNTVYEDRYYNIQDIRAHPEELPAKKKFYQQNIGQFINDFGMTFNPKVAGVDERDSTLPLLLFPVQEDVIDWVMDLLRNRARGMIPKGRGEGATWITVAVAVSLCVLNNGYDVGFGSNLLEKVDTLNNRSTILEKARFFARHLPEEFNGGFTEKTHKHKLLTFPETNSTISGDGGPQIGRGDRKKFFIVDEFSSVENPESAEAALVETAETRLFVSTPKGAANRFTVLWKSKTIAVFPLHWHTNPTKDQAWYDKATLGLDPVMKAQEYDLDPYSSVDNVVIPKKWVDASVDSHIVLGIEPTGSIRLGYDVADEGADKCATAGGPGILLDHLDEWTGKGDDVHGSTVRVFNTAEKLGCVDVVYDAAGIGGGAKASGRVINEYRVNQRRAVVAMSPFMGGGAVEHPERMDVKGIKNKDRFLNRKAQAFWALRTRFEKTYQAVVQGMDHNPDELISISSQLPPDLFEQLKTELCQPTYDETTNGKLIIDKKPDGSKSPNLADAVMMRFSGVGKRRTIDPQYLANLSRMKTHATQAKRRPPTPGNGYGRLPTSPSPTQRYPVR